MDNMSKAFQMESNQYDRGTKILGLLGEEACLLIVHELIVSGPLNVFELIAALNIPKHTILQHLQILYAFKIVTCEYKSHQVYCAVEDETIIEIMKVLGFLD
ncbi:transcriptional regulator [Bacillus sp. BH2]|uniref:ArsR/SmtB family transcription factor n=1 Tax=Bacillus sp. BH2 TaxID=2528958 RepID=UPI001064F481|nr:helix-turn-helix transcriptional regulator [Bacillus sp. BH2]TEA46700.1 transcriptional regulator [Bacillus sp. BH2]